MESRKEAMSKDLENFNLTLHSPAQKRKLNESNQRENTSIWKQTISQNKNMACASNIDETSDRHYRSISRSNSRSPSRQCLMDALPTSHPRMSSIVISQNNRPSRLRSRSRLFSKSKSRSPSANENFSGTRNGCGYSSSCSKNKSRGSP